MSIAAAVLLLAGGAQDAPPVMPARLDDIGMAARTDSGNGTGVFVVHRSLPAGSFAEVTALDNGRTILAEVRPGAPLPPDRVADLSPGAAQALGIGNAVLVPVRVRPILPAPQDQTVLRGGGAVRRLDTPEALLVALRRRLPATPRPMRDLARVDGLPALASVAPPVARAPVAASAAPPPAAGRWFVQVAALSDASRADTLAKSVGGVVRRVGTLYRVQAGPFATRAAADTARAALARRGFGDARTTQSD